LDCPTYNYNKPGETLTVNKEAIDSLEPNKAFGIDNITLGLTKKTFASSLFLTKI